MNIDKPIRTITEIKKGTDKEIRKKGIYRFLIYESYNKTEKL